MLLAGVAGGLLAGPGNALAQDGRRGDAAAGAAMAENDLPAATLLDRITVVSRTEEAPIDALASVSHVGREELDRRMASTPLGTLFGVPGVTVQADQRRAASSINIRGLQDFGRVAVIVDGARQNFQRSDHGTQSTFYLDPELIERVDVIRGPVANTYGSGAIGGVVAFETKDASDFLRPGETYAGSVRAGYETNGEGWTTSGTGAVRFSDSAEVIGNLVWRDYSDYDDGNGDPVEGSGFDVLSGLLKGTFRPMEYSKLELGWIGANEDWTEYGSGGAQAFGLRQHTLTARYNIADPDRTWLDLHVNGSINKVLLDQVYQNDVVQFDPDTGFPITLPAGSGTSYDLTTYNIDLWNTSRFDTGALSHELTYGGDFANDHVVNVGPSGASDVYTPTGDRRLWGAYVQDKLTYDWFEIIGGLRYDSYKLDSDVAENSGDRLSPRITVGVSPFDGKALSGLQFYGTYAEGYRSPSISETLISGLHPSGVTFPFLPNPDLLPETGKTWEAGVNYKLNDAFVGGDALRIKAAYFHNDIDDFIDATTLSAGAPGCPFIPGLPIPPYIPMCYQYQNFDSASIQGFEVEGAYDMGRYFAGLSVSLIDGYRTTGGVREDLVTVPSSQVTGTLGARFLESKLTLGGEVQYNGAPDGNMTAEDYTLVNLFANYQATEDLRFDFRVDNLFDEKYANPLNASTTGTVFEPGLSVKFAATLRFGG